MTLELKIPDGLKAREFSNIRVFGKEVQRYKDGTTSSFNLYKNDWQKTVESMQKRIPTWCDKKTSAHLIAYIGTEYDKLNDDDDPSYYDDVVREKTTIPSIQQKILRVILEQYECETLKRETGEPWPAIELPIEQLSLIGTCSELRLHYPPYENPTLKPCGNPLGQPYFLSYVNVANNDTLFSDPIMDPVEEPTQMERIIESVKASIDERRSIFTGIERYAVRKSLIQRILESKRRICQKCYDERSKVANDATRYVTSLPDVQEKVQEYMESSFHPFDDFPPDFTLVDSIYTIFSLEDEQTLKNSEAIHDIDVHDVRKQMRKIIENTNKPFPNEQELKAYLLKYCNDYGEPYNIQGCRIFYLGVDHKKRPRFKIIVHFSQPEGHSQIFDVPHPPSGSRWKNSVYLDGQMIYNGNLGRTLQSDMSPHSYG
jgi:hypothetical protein